MKTLFLDIDGVIALGWNKAKDTKWGKIYKFDEKAVKVLNEVLLNTGAEIVLSSDWKKSYSLQEIREIFEWNGVIKGPISYTINSNYYEEANTLEWMAGARAFEIMDYVKRHRLNDWAAIDDLPILDSGHSDFFINNFIHCKRSYEGIKQSGLKDKLIKVLNKHDKG